MVLRRWVAMVLERIEWEQSFPACTILGYLFIKRDQNESNKEDLKKTDICFPHIFSGKTTWLFLIYLTSNSCDYICSDVFSVLLYCFCVPFCLCLISIILISILCFWQLLLWDLSHPSLVSYYLFRPSVLLHPLPHSPWQLGRHSVF